MTKTLVTITKLREIAVNQAREHLVGLLAKENLARAQADAADAQIQYEGKTASDLSTGDHVVEAFAVWLPIGRAKAAEARAQHERSLQDVSRARAVLNAALVAAEAARKYFMLAEAERGLLKDRRDQRTEDEMASQISIRKESRDN